MFFFFFDQDSVQSAYRELRENDELKSPEHLKQEYSMFRKRFGPEILDSLDDEELLETMFNVMNRDGLVYWLEYKNDDVFDTMLYGSIAGGSALKYLIFKRKSDGKWVTGSAQKQVELSLNEAVRKGRAIRDAILKGAELLSRMDNPTIDDYRVLQEQLDSETEYKISTYGWIHKYYHMLFPDLIEIFHSLKWQKHILLCMGQPPLGDGLYILSGQMMSEIKKIDLPTCHTAKAMMHLYGAPISYYRIGTKDDSNDIFMWDKMRAGEYISIGWPQLGDLRQYAVRDESAFKKKVRPAYESLYHNAKQTMTLKINEIDCFFRGIKENDLVAACDGMKLLGIGRVIGSYEYLSNLDFPHIRRVEWLFTGREQLPQAKEGLRTTVKQYKDIANVIKIRELAASGHQEPIHAKEVVNLPDVKPLLPLEGELRKIESILERKKQVILYGPPGTGKTYYAEKAARELAARKRFKCSYDSLSHEDKEIIIGDGRQVGLVRMCCFHPTYGYEDFIEGIKPRVANGVTLFEPRDGLFKKLCDDARNTLKQSLDYSYFLIIDEINRGDISRIFGELIMLLEVGKRGKNLTLSVSGDTFSVPPNLYIIGTMNTADRSIALLDVALRRRFGFRELMPNYQLLKGVSFGALPLAEWLRQLNQRILHLLGIDARNLQIGHSYFMESGKVICSSELFRQVLAEDVLPLLEEYCYGDYGMLSGILGQSLVDEKNKSLRNDLVSGNFADLINALLQPCVDIRRTDTEDDVESAEDEESDLSAITETAEEVLA